MTARLAMINAAFLATMMLLAVMTPLVLAGVQNSNVDKSEKVASIMPRFTGPKKVDIAAIVQDPGLDTTWVNADQSTGKVMDYAVNLAILAGVGIVFAVLSLLWMIFRCLCGRCCHCWRCNCCCDRGRDTRVTTVVLVFFLIVTFSFCVVGYISNSQVDDAVAGGSSGLTEIIPGFLEIGIDAADTCNTSINTITSGAGSILTQVGDVYIPQIEGDVLTGTQTLVDATDNLVTALGALDEVTGGNFDTKTYTCLVCSTLVTNAGDLTTQVHSQTDAVVADFQSVVDGIQTNLVGIKGTIVNSTADVQGQVSSIRSQLVDFHTKITDYMTKVETYENYRKIGFICLFLFPLLTLPFIICGIIYKKTRGNNLFTVAIYLVYFYVFLTLIIYAVHILFSTLLADVCVYGDNYETTTLASKAQDCAVDPTGSQCNIYEYVNACLSGTSLMAVANLSDTLNFSKAITFPTIPSFNGTFTFSELDTLDTLFAGLTVQDMGFPSCYVDALVDRYNGDDDPEQVPTPPTTSDNVVQALWLQEHLGYDLKFPHVAFTGTHNSYNYFTHGKRRTHLNVNTNVGGQAVQVQQTTTNQIHTLTEQLERLGVRRLEIDAHYLTAGTGSTQGKHCNANLGSPVQRMRVCDGDSARAAAIKTVCDNDWNICESLCMCDYGLESTACPVDAPLLDDILKEIRDFMLAKDKEIVTLVIHNHMAGNDVELNNLLTAVFGGLLYTPTNGFDYSDATNWITPNAMLTAGTRLVVFSDKSDVGPACSATGPTSAVLTNTFCNSALRPQYTYTAFLSGQQATCQTTQTLPFFQHISSTRLQQALVLLGSDASSDESNGGQLTVNAAKLVEINKCGWAVDLDGLDSTLAPGALWSFDTTYADSISAASSYAYFTSALSMRWMLEETSAGSARRCACRHTTNTHDWKLTAAAFTFGNCAAECVNEHTASYAFRVPSSAFENNFLKTAFTAASSPPAGVFVNLELSAAMVPKSNGGADWAVGAWSNAAVAAYAFGAQPGVVKTAAQIAALPSTPLVDAVADLLLDEALVAAHLTALKTAETAISTAADVLFNNWTVVESVINTVKSDTLGLFDAADTVIELFDNCADIDSQYLLLKDTVCNDTVEGAVGIAMSAFFIGMVGICLIFTLGAMVKGCKLPKDLEDPMADDRDLDDSFNTDFDAKPPPYTGKPMGQEWNQMQPVTQGYSAY